MAAGSVRTNGHYWLTPLVSDVTQNCYRDPSTDPVNLVNGALPAGARAAFGNAAFDSLTGPGLNNWDAGIHKSFSLYRETKFTLRGEFFNAFNHAQFANPNSGVSSGASFGKITATQRDNREIQIGGTLNF